MQLTPISRPNRSTRWLALAMAAALSTLVFIVLQPQQILSANTPSGGDMGAHVLVPAFLRDNLLPSLRISGWSNDWFAGFPILYFYFPLPALTIVALDLVMPYGVAFKLVTLMALLAMPFGAYYLARQAGAPRFVAGLAGVGGGTFVLMESYAIYGGNIKSTLAGEYSYSWAMAFSLFYLGAVLRDVRSEDRRFSPLAALMLAGMALSHVIPTMVVGTASLLFLAYKRRGRVVLGWALGFAVAAFWVVPLIATIGFTTDMNFSPLRGFASQTGGPLPTEIWPLIPLAVLGFGWSLWKRYRLAVVGVITMLPLLAYPFVSGKLWNGRLLPYWYFGVFFFAGLAVGLAMLTVRRRLPGRTAPLVAMGLLGAAILVIPPASGLEQSSSWARWNYSGYEGKDPWAEYENLMAEVSTLPPGRIMWEANSEMDRYGTPMALMLFPYWSDDHPSMEGLLFESSLSTPFHFMNAAEVSERPSNPIPGLPYSGFDLDRGLAHMQLFNVRYYVTFTETATSAARNHPDYTEVAQAAPWTVFEIPEDSLVEVAQYQPAVYEPDDDVGVFRRLGLIVHEDEELDDFFNGAVAWHSQVETLDRWMVESGPDEWPRVQTGLVGLSDTPAIESGGTVTNVVLEDHRIEFDTTAIGVPHLVKVSFFPNWQASGAEGPFRAAPAFMVVVPTEEHVELTFSRRWYENLGFLLTGLALAGLGGWALVRRRATAA